ncbi:S9 family peptidase [Qipengyuania zhejiangensis]|uniref:S9 family peptidase n=1 Tax=Qipengyuania zhejiangensis TaxID=3077782 RepID=UPI002D7688D1|nr:S9 family peptidase [Qipengyuania sp. Z2]
MVRSFALLAAVSLVAIAVPASAQSHEGHAAAEQVDIKTYTAEQFFQSTSYSVGSPEGFNFSPDGRFVLVNSDATGVFNAYLMPVDGGTPVPLTASADDATYGASFFPGDGRLLFTADNGGDELNHLFVREEDGTVCDLSPGEKVKAGFAGWSDDGQTFFATTNERDPAAFDLYAYDAATYERRRLFTNEGAFSVDAVSGDGRWVALSKANSSADSDLYLVDLAADEPAPRLVTPHEGNVSYGAYTFNRDNDALVYATDEHGEFNQAWSLDLLDGERAAVIEAGWDVAFVQFSPSGRYRVSGINADALTEVEIFDDVTQKTVTLKGLPEASLGSIRFDADEKRIAFTVSSDTSPVDIYVADLGNGQATRLTTALNPAIDESDLVTSTVARFKSYDGLEIPGILFRPHGASADKPVPAVVLVHGGPGGQSTRGYSAMIQHLVNNGYAVYAINNRGSSGYGKTFFHLDDKRHGDVDLKDVVASKGFLQGLDWVANDRIAIMGGSYGGYMVAAALAFHPEVFDAGVNIFGVTNWVRTLKSIPPWWGSFRDALYDEMGDPETDETRHRAISPLFHASNIVKPLLVVQGANDPRVLQVESDELVAAVKANNVPVEYVLFPDEGHGFRGKTNRITASEAYLEFLDEHIGR